MGERNTTAECELILKIAKTLNMKITNTHQREQLYTYAVWPEMRLQYGWLTHAVRQCGLIPETILNKHEHWWFIAPSDAVNTVFHYIMHTWLNKPNIVLIRDTQATPETVVVQALMQISMTAYKNK